MQAADAACRAHEERLRGGGVVMTPLTSVERYQCEAATNGSWREAEDRRCKFRATFLLAGKRLCALHARVERARIIDANEEKETA
jgi:hypothetical protein